MIHRKNVPDTGHLPFSSVSCQEWNINLNILIVPLSFSSQKRFPLEKWECSLQKNFSVPSSFKFVSRCFLLFEHSTEDSHFPSLLIQAVDRGTFQALLLVTWTCLVSHKPQNVHSSKRTESLPRCQAQAFLVPKFGLDSIRGVGAHKTASCFRH